MSMPMHSRPPGEGSPTPRYPVVIQKTTGKRYQVVLHISGVGVELRDMLGSTTYRTAEEFENPEIWEKIP